MTRACWRQPRSEPAPAARSGHQALPAKTLIVGRFLGHLGRLVQLGRKARLAQRASAFRASMATMALMGGRAQWGRLAPQARQGRLARLDDQGLQGSMAKTATRRSLKGSTRRWLSRLANQGSLRCSLVTPVGF